MTAVSKGRLLWIEGGNLYFKFHKDVQILESTTTTHNQTLNKYMKKQQVTNAEMVHCRCCCLSLVSSSSVLAAEPGSGSNVAVGAGISRNSGPDTGPGSGPGKASGEKKTLGQQSLAQQIPRWKGEECGSCGGFSNDQALKVFMLSSLFFNE